MDIKLAGKIISYFKPYSMLINKAGEVLWLSNKMKTLLNSIETDNAGAILNIDLEMLLSNNQLKITIDEDIYYLSKIFLKKEEAIVLIFDLLGDYNEPTTKSICLDEIIENLYDGVLLTDKDGKVVIYNHAMEELEKYDAEDMIGKYIWEAYGYNDINQSEHMQVLDSGIAIINKYKAHAYNNGKPVYKSYSTHPIRINGDIIGVYSISKDETKLQSLLTESVELKRQYNKKLDEDDNKLYKNGSRFNFSDIIGSSEIMKTLIKEAEAISWLDNSIDRKSVV